jgi:isocitrate/isopropylmalate dehydrogenase
MMLRHIGSQDKAERLEKALEICGQYEKRLVITGRNNGATASEYGDYLMETMNDPELEEKWKRFSSQD